MEIQGPLKPHSQTHTSIKNVGVMGPGGTVSQAAGGGVPGVNRRQALVSLIHDQGTMTRI